MSQDPLAAAPQAEHASLERYLVSGLDKESLARVLLISFKQWDFTTGVEAAYARKPVIVMGPSAYDELRCATRVRTSAVISEALDARASGDWSGAMSYDLIMKGRGFSSRYVTRDSRGFRTLAGIPMDEASPRVLHLSHLLDRLKRWNLTR